MHRIDGDGNVAGMFDPGDPFIPLPATQVTADWANAIQEELVNVIQTEGGVTLSKPDNTQLWAALVARFGRLGSANTWSGNQSFGGTVAVTATTTLTGRATLNGGLTVNEVSGQSVFNGVGAAVSGSGGLPTKYVFGFGTVPDTAGQNYGLTALVAATAGNMVRLDTRLETTGLATTWTNVRLGLSFDVDSAVGAGGSLWFNNGRVEAQASAAATATTRTVALKAVNGDISLDGVVNPGANVAMKNTLTPRNFVKVSATIKTTSSNGTIVVDDAFNVAAQPAGVALNGSLIRVTFAQAFASANYQVTFGINDSWGGVFSLYWRTKTAAYVDIAVSQVNGTSASFATLNTYFDISITGAQ